MTDASSPTRGLPAPELAPFVVPHDKGPGAVDRWSPSRAGLVNVWRFDEETFGFHRGRLLLRGPNGAGKSMALELLFPFLLDADASPFRLTSGVKARGGLYDRVMTGTDAPSRVGFVWGEFRSGSEVFTLGARLRASSATRRADTDWFTARLEVGCDLHLLDADRVPVSRAGLAAAIGDAGRVHDSGQDYRAAVRAALFPGFSAAQYDALVTALLALRREKISQDLNPAKLSEVLTASLPALDEKDVSEIAEGFQRLDRRRDELARLESDLAQVRDLARRQRDYARRVIVSVANEVRAAETGRDDVTRKEREARAQLAEASEARERCIAEAEAAASRKGDLAAETETLRNLDAYREGAQLEQLQHRRAQLARDVEREQEAAARRRNLFDQAADAVSRAEDAAGARRADLGRAAAELGSAAEALGVGPTVDEASALDDPDEAEGLLAAWTESRRAQLAEVEHALAYLEERIRVRNDRDEAVETERRILQARDAERAEAESRAEDEAEAYRAAVRAWIAACELLEASRLEAEIPSPPDDPPAVTAAIGRVESEAVASLAARRGRMERSAEDLDAEAGVLAVEREELAAGQTPEPDAFPWRSDREGRPGAPLWRLIDFAGSCPPADRDGVEAALLASGLLDAWVSPDGAVALPDGTADAFVDGERSAAAGRSLRDVLAVLPDAAVPAEVVSRVLGVVGVVDAAVLDWEEGSGPDAVIGRDGSYRLGALVGRGPVQPSRYIGAAAQERERARRIAELDEAIEDLRRRAAGLREEIEGLDRRRKGIEAEVALAPDGGALLAARRAWERARDLFDESEARLRAAEGRRSEAEQAVREAQRSLMHLATRHGLPADGAGVRRYGDHLDAFGRAAAVWSRRRWELVQTNQELLRRQAERSRADAELAEARDRLADADRDHRELSVTLETLEASVGAEYREVVARIEAAGRERQALERHGRELETERAGLERRIGGLEERVEEAAQRRVDAEVRRDAAHLGFLAVVNDGFADDAEAKLNLEGTDTPTGVLDAARSVAARFPNLDAQRQAVVRAQNSVLEGFHTAGQTLRGRVDLSFEQSQAGWWLLRAATEGIRSRVPQLVRRMSDQFAVATEELTEEEQRLFDETLTGSLRASVAERIRQANGLIDEINRALASVRTDAAGVQVRLRWEMDPDQPYASKSVRTLLLKDAATYTESEREALYEFFRGRLDQVRAELEASSGWEERLREVLDYRRWHRFGLEVAHRDWEGFAPATAARLQRLSTGERSIALHLPMLASITAHYDGAAPGDAPACPRLILLDELFAGVDQSNRGRLFGLFVAWDLDAVFTSDHEWCAYSSLDGIAIHHLHGSGSDGPVVSSRFVWNGRSRVAAPLGA